MKKILITGKNSYIGRNLLDWLKNHPASYIVDTISLRDDLWQGKAFTDYDVIIHVAGLAHIKETKENSDLYYKINRDLALQVAQKAKDEGVQQFIFMSTMSVYGLEKGVIGPDTSLNPKNSYGKSKLQAEKIITRLEDDMFKVAIIRPPMIYGKGCKGNYPKIAKLALITPFFPKVHNKRSMIYVENLSEFIRLIIDQSNRGVFFPQNKEYVCTSTLVTTIAKKHGKKVLLFKALNPIIKIISNSTMNKVFGDLVYEKAMSSHDEINYSIQSFEDSVRATED